jgi:hypothetical protein
VEEAAAPISLSLMEKKKRGSEEKGGGKRE